MPRFETIDTLPALRGGAAGIRVLLRGDLNVPMRNGLIADATRIERLRPTIEELTKRGCKVIVCRTLIALKARWCRKCR